MGTIINTDVIDNLYRDYVLRNDTKTDEKILKSVKSLLHKQLSNLSVIDKEKLIEVINVFISRLVDIKKIDTTNLVTNLQNLI